MNNASCITINATVTDDTNLSVLVCAWVLLPRLCTRLLFDHRMQASICLFVQYLITLIGHIIQFYYFCHKHNLFFPLQTFDKVQETQQRDSGSVDEAAPSGRFRLVRWSKCPIYLEHTVFNWIQYSKPNVTLNHPIRQSSNFVSQPSEDDACQVDGCSQRRLWVAAKPKRRPSNSDSAWGSKCGRSVILNSNILLQEGAWTRTWWRMNPWHFVRLYKMSTQTFWI